MAKSAIEARSLVKYFGNKLVIDGVHLGVEQGECFAILGALGAGKSTLMQLLSSYLSPSAGELFIKGFNAKVIGQRAKTYIGMLFQQDIFDEQFSVFENLWIYSSYYGLNGKQAKERIREILIFLDLAEFEESAISDLSFFERRCLSLARALVHNPEILILDEILSGLLPQQQEYLVLRLKDLLLEGKTILFSTDSYTEASTLATRVGILTNGKLQLEGTAIELVEEQIGQEVVEFVCPEQEIDYIIRKISGIYDFRLNGRRFYVYVRKGQDSRAILDLIASDDLSLRKAKLSDVVTKLDLSH